MTVTVDIHQNWIDQLKKGDQSAARNIYDSYSKAMYNTLIRLTGNSDDAQDLLQEAFIKAFRKIESFRGSSTFGAWLKKIVVNTGLEHLRKKKVVYEELSEKYEKVPEPDESAMEIDPYQVHESIKKLPDGTRTVLSLYLLEGYTHNEISGILGITESTSKTQFMRGKAILREQLKSKMYG